MKLTYVSHACLLLESKKSGKIVTDPWFNGPCYFNQWHVFPKPIDTSFIDDVNVIILTHAHEDHLHIPTLQLMNKDAVVYYPYTWIEATRQSLLDLGFYKIIEVASQKKVQLNDELSFTFIVNGLDAFVVYEYENQVVINLNDALNAAHWSFVEVFTKIIKKTWTKVDLLICGLGGAGYFPNTVHATNKDDKEIALLREQFLVHKFLEIVEEILPDQVMSFVPGFALLEEDKLWINEMRFNRNDVQDYYEKHFQPTKKIIFKHPMPGDYYENNTCFYSSFYHQLLQEMTTTELIKKQYNHEFEQVNKPCFNDKKALEAITKSLNQIFSVNTLSIANELLQQVNFIIECKDIRENYFIHCYYNKGKLAAETVENRPPAINIKMTTHSWKLAYAVNEFWGGDVFYIGYGADLYIIDEACLKDNIDIVSLRILSRFPSASFHMKKNPMRALKYMLINPPYTVLALKQKIITRGNPNKLPYNERAHWVNKSKCDVCLLCDIPLMTNEIAH